MNDSGESRSVARPINLLINLLRKLIKSGTSAFAIAEKADADALPIAGTEGEGFASSGEVEAIGAERELMTIGLTVISDAHPELRELALQDDLTFTLSLNKNAVLAKADATEGLATTEESGIAVARGREQRGALALIAHHFLGQHVAALLQTIGSVRTIAQKVFVFISF